MKLFLTQISFCAMLVFFIVSCESSKTLTINNGTGKDINEILISASDSKGFEDANLIEGKILAKEASIEIDKTVFKKPGLYDITFTDTEDNDYYKYDVDVKGLKSITVMPGDLDKK